MAVGATSKLPVSGTGVSGEFVIEGRPAQPGEQLVADRRIVTPDYFRVMSIPLVGGRFFDERDAGRARFALINQVAAKRFWPGEGPVGRRIGVSGNTDEDWLEIIGVVGDVRHSTISADPKPEIYLPYFQSPWHNMTVVAKLDPAALDSAPSFRGAVLSVDRSQPVYNIRTLQQVVDEALKQPRFNVVLLSVAYAAGRSLSSLLFEVPGFDLSTYATVSAVFVLVMLAASLIPARRGRLRGVPPPGRRSSACPACNIGFHAWGQ